MQKPKPTEEANSESTCVYEDPLRTLTLGVWLPIGE